MKYSPLFPTLSASSKLPMTVACSGAPGTLPRLWGIAHTRNSSGFLERRLRQPGPQIWPEPTILTRRLKWFGSGRAPSAVETVQNSEISNILLYKTTQGESRIEVIFNSDTFWMPQKRMAELYGVDVRTVSYHLAQIYESGELQESATIQKIGITAADGSCRTEVRISADLRQVSCRLAWFSGYSYG